MKQKVLNENIRKIFYKKVAKVSTVLSTTMIFFDIPDKFKILGSV